MQHVPVLAMRRLLQSAAGFSIWVKEQDSSIKSWGGIINNQPILNTLTNKYVKFGYKLPCIINNIGIYQRPTKTTTIFAASDFEICKTNCGTNDCLGMNSIDYNGYNKCLNKGY